MLINFVGVIGQTPNLTFLNSGKAVCKFSVGITKRKFNKTTNEWENGETTWMNCTAWGETAERVGECLNAKDVVMVSGDFEQRSWNDKEGQKRTTYEVQVKDVGPTLSRVAVQVQRVQRGPQGARPSGRPQPEPAPVDPFAGPAGDWDEPPF